MQYAWTCSCCGKQYDTLPLDFAADAPEYWYAIPEDERERRAVLTPDFCTLDHEHHFIRGCLELPILNSEEKLVFGAWVSLSQASMSQAQELWCDPAEGTAPLYGWFSTAIKLYPGSLQLKAAVCFRGVDLRPAIELEPSEHPLSRDQRQGISMERVQEIVAALMHRH